MVEDATSETVVANALFDVIALAYHHTDRVKLRARLRVTAKPAEDTPLTRCLYEMLCTLANYLPERENDAPYDHSSVQS